MSPRPLRLPGEVHLTDILDTSYQPTPQQLAEGAELLDGCDYPTQVPGPGAYDQPPAEMRRHLTPVPDLDDVLEGDDPDIDQEPTGAIDADVADRWLRRLGRLAAQDRADEELANARIATINTWLMARREARRPTVEFFERSIELWHLANLRANPKAAKSITLPAGKVASRAQQPEWDFDDTAFVAWAREHAPELVNQPPPPAPKPDKAAAKKHLDVPALEGATPGVPLVVVDGDGEIVPGVTVVARTPKVTVTPA